MSEKPKKSQSDSPFREVKPKNSKFGLSVPRVKYPHEEYPRLAAVPLASKSTGDTAETNNQDENTGYTGYTGYTGITDATNAIIGGFESNITAVIEADNKTTEVAQRLVNLQPVSPTRDFTKTPNSINRLAMAQGLFKGKSKQIYDYLWQASRGAVKPSRVIRRTHAEIKKGTGIGSRNTIIDGIKHLSAIGLIKFVSSVGVNDGNKYEVFTPEECGYTGSTGITGTTATSTTTGITGISQNLVIPVIPESGTTGITQVIDEQDSYRDAKTSFKTIKEEIDDEPQAVIFSELNKVLFEATQRITGKQTTQSDREKWKHVAEILAAQLELIASRTAISNAPAVLAEHLHRQLNSKRALEKMGLIAPAEAREAKETTASAPKPKEVIKDLYLCPDCFGTTFWNPDGKGRRSNCPHNRLEEARAKVKENGDI